MLHPISTGRGWECRYMSGEWELGPMLAVFSIRGAQISATVLQDSD